LTLDNSRLKFNKNGNPQKQPRAAPGMFSGGAR
jgi:hypothetical protein